MPTKIDLDDARKIRANLERQGRPVPAALREATDSTEPAGPTGGPRGPKNARTPKRAAATPAAAPRRPAGHPLAGTAGRARPSRAPAPAKPRVFNPTGSKVKQPSKSGRTVQRQARSLLRNPGQLGGNGGGMLLAVFLYPLVLAVIKQGAAGPGLWLRAKFLNQETAPPQGSYWAGKPGSPGVVSGSANSAEHDSPGPLPSRGK